MSDLEAAKGAVMEAIKSYVAAQLAPVVAKLATFETAIAAIPAGKDGAPGADAEVDYDRVKALLNELIPEPVAGEKGEPGGPGLPGEPGAAAVVDYEQVRKDIEALIPPPVPGNDGRDAPSIDDLRPIIVEEARAAAEALPKPKDGESVPLETVEAMVQKAVTALPPPQDGINGLNGKDGQDGQDGKDGQDGRDAAELVILPEIVPTRSYARGTFAKYRGGLVRAVRGTSPIVDGKLLDAGWECLVEGIADVQVEQGDDFRSFAIGVESTSGSAFVKTFAVPALIYRDQYIPETAYKAGDCVTWGGSMWVARAETTEAPGRSNDWRLSAKKGNDGKDWDAPKPAKPAEPIRLR